MRAAAAVFPLERRFRTGAADFYAEFRFKGSGGAAIEAMRQALRQDPHNAGMRRNLAGFLVEAGDLDAAGAEVAAVARLTPRSHIVLRVNTNPLTR